VLNSSLLKKLIREKKRTIKELADILGLTYETFRRKCAGQISFYGDEVLALMSELDITDPKEIDAIFFDEPE